MIEASLMFKNLHWVCAYYVLEINLRDPNPTLIDNERSPHLKT